MNRFMGYLSLLFLFIASLAVQGYSALPVTYLLVIAGSINLPARRALILAFLAGIVVDFAFGATLGLHGAFYLLSCFIPILYQRKFQTGSLWYVAIFTFIFLSLYYRIFFRYFPLSSVLILLFIMFGLNRFVEQLLSWRRLKLRL